MDVMIRYLRPLVLVGMIGNCAEFQTVSTKMQLSVHNKNPPASFWEVK